MNTAILTPSEVAIRIADNAKYKQWLSCTFQVSRSQGVFSVGVKAYGKWVQRIECGGVSDGLPEQRTIKALRAESEAMINRILDSVVES